jgi:hypothetical protein
VASGTAAQLHGSQEVVAMGVHDRIMIMLQCTGCTGIHARACARLSQPHGSRS